jgi:hypothetical protein
MIVGYGGQSSGFPMGLNPAPFITTFPQASLRSRKVGFPASYVVDHIRIVMWRSPICGAPPAWADGIGHGVVLAAT